MALRPHEDLFSYIKRCLHNLVSMISIYLLMTTGINADTATAAMTAIA